MVELMGASENCHMKIAVHTPIEQLVPDPFAGQRHADVATATAKELVRQVPSVDALENKLLDVDQVDCPVVHRFGPGVYIREVTLPAGTLAIGHRHKFAHINIVLKGTVLVLNDNGTSSEIEAPFVYTSQPGRKVVLAKTEVVWQNIFATTERDVETLEAYLLDKSDAWLEDSEVRMKAAALRHENDRADYLAAIAEFGITHDLAWQIASNPSDQIPMPLGSYKMIVTDSPIHGKGVFATAAIAPGELIAPARVDGKRTPAGRYTNHAAEPNAIMVLRPNGDIDLVACKPIAGCQGGQPGEEITIDYRQALGLSRQRSQLCQQ